MNVSQRRESTPEDRERLRALAAEFNERVVLPAAPDLDRQPAPEDRFSWEIVEEASRAGLRTLTLAPEYGGPGLDSLGAAIVIEELAKADTGVAIAIGQTMKLIQTIQAACTDEQKERFLPRIRDDDRFLLAIGLTEPETSSNYIMPFDDPGAGYRTTAVARNGGWVLNGFKHFISNGNRAGLYLIFATTTPEADITTGSTCFLVEPDAEGFGIGTIHDKFGERLANNAELVLEDCLVPDENVVGEVDRGFDVQRRFFTASNAYAAAVVLGVATAAYERALAWTRGRVQGGKPLIDHDSVAADLAEMRMQLDVARTYTRHAARAADDPERGWDPTLSAFPKVFASQVGWDVTTRAVELHGGYAYMKDRDTGIEKLLRDAASFLHSDGANRSLLLKAAKSIRAEEV